MYPNEFLNLFPSFPRNNKVFVAMSFLDIYKPRWGNIIVPGIKKIEVNGKPLEPYRIDLGVTGDSIQTEILKEITTCRLVLGEITSLGNIEGIPIRNGNVLYEIGIAHAARLPEEVILFRSDSDPLLFDVTNIRVHTYNPDNLKAATDSITTAVLNSLKEIDLKKSLAVNKVTSQLDFQAWIILAEAEVTAIRHPAIKTIRDVMSSSRRIDSINKLLELGLLEIKFKKIPIEEIISHLEKSAEGIVEYEITTFGKAVFENSIYKFGYTLEEIIKIMPYLENQ